MTPLIRFIILVSRQLFQTDFIIRSWRFCLFRCFEHPTRGCCSTGPCPFVPSQGWMQNQHPPRHQRSPTIGIIRRAFISLCFAKASQVVGVSQKRGGSRTSCDRAVDVSLTGDSWAFPRGKCCICIKAAFTPRLITPQTASDSPNISHATKNPLCDLFFLSTSLEVTCMFRAQQRRFGSE